MRQCDRQDGAWKTHPYTEAGQDAPFTKVDAGNTQTTVSGLSDGVTYTFKVGAVNASGTTWSDLVDGTTGTNPPATPQRSPGNNNCPGEGMPPSMLSHTLSGTEVTLRWTASTHDDLVSQWVRRRVVNSGSVVWTDFAVALDATSWTDTTAQSGTTYVYRVQTKRPKTGPNGQMSNPQVVTIP